ncbi:pyridoxal phosphate-dependent aminotransferase [Xinfangfangia sp. CPCC 101601]|uniref:histidinol-phosphate transaminase n=1 Tax=Pseudogemmobacter lacusdianii TaxID=3069608 RepID=A0ABU0W1D4_9RHOB|nr:pyridoxal phosphate-dependent aminotransferase [Xinfangfangia sp. CPCC 101601]MDQ2067573.1 pyridoxal phosphate-dependent aminotransferase [Xinfangfangia sp. CPCC 101601]
MSQFLTDHTRALPSTVPFTGPETLERQQGFPFRARLGANESIFGPSPKAIAAMTEAVAEVWQYGEPENYDLKQALAAFHNCTPAHIVVGPGVDGLLNLICRLTLEPGVNVVTSLGAYPTFNFHVAGHGGTLHRVPYKGVHEDIDGLLSAARSHKARLIYLANPDNPMGSHHPASAIEELVANLPEGALLVLDEAYADLAPADAIPQIAPDHPQVIRFRTFSKGYGLAGARVGYAITNPELALAFDKVRDHFGMGRISQIGALAALADQEYLSEIKAQVAAGRARLGQIAADNGLTALTSATNFVTIDLHRDGDFARKVLRESQTRGLFIRMPGVAPLDRCIRISIGPEAAMDVVAEVLPEALKAAG